MNFDYMTNSQIAALIIGLVFSVIAVGTTFLSIKYAKRFDSFLKAIAITLVAPFIAFAAWLFLIFSFLDGFRNDELLNILISIVIALVICGVIIIIAKALYQKHQAELLEAEFEKDREPVPEFEDEQKETLLIEDRKENEENNIEVQEDTTIENEDADIIENEDVDQQESEEQEETDTENEESAEDETKETIEPIEDQQDPNAPIVEDYVSDTTTPASEENPNVSLAQDEESEDEDDDEDDDDDEDFEKFLESLRKKAEMRKNQNQNTNDEEGENN